MATDSMSRRDFLKLALAGAAAAGLSHFRVLNSGGVQPVAAVGCIPPTTLNDNCGAEPDICDPSGSMGPADTCSVALPAGDHCGEISAMGPVPDTCQPSAPPTSDPDACNVATGELDQCGTMPPPTDNCVSRTGDPDICGAPTALDTCQPDDATPDTVNAVSLEGVQAHGGGLLTALGGAAAVVALGAALTTADKSEH